MTIQIASLTRTRYWVRVAVRMLAVLLVLLGSGESLRLLLGFLEEAGLRGGYMTINLTDPTFWGTLLAPLIACTAAAVVLAAFDTRIARWVTPVPKDECPQCGYAIEAGASRCPECGMKLDVSPSEP